MLDIGFKMVVFNHIKHGSDYFILFLVGCTLDL